MFRSKKGAAPTANDVPAEPEPAVVAPPPEEAPAAPTRRAAPLAARPMPPTPFPLDIARRTVDFGLPTGRTEAAAAPVKDKVMAIGRDVRLTGEIAACDKLIVEGIVELAVSGARLLQIGSGGNFKGSADVAEAEIGGHFDGALIVRDRLTIRGSGDVRGRIRYGQIVIEAGGAITGDVAALHGEEDATASPSSPATGFARARDGEAQLAVAD